MPGPSLEPMYHGLECGVLGEWGRVGVQCWRSGLGGVSGPCRLVLWAGWMEAAPEFLQAAPCDF